MMDVPWISIIKETSNVLAGIFLILGAVFSFLEKWHEGRNHKVRKWFAQKWYVIRANKILTLPERAIEWILNLRSSISNNLSNTFFPSSPSKHHKNSHPSTHKYKINIDPSHLVILFLIILFSIWIMLGVWIFGGGYKINLFIGGCSIYLILCMMYLECLEYISPWIETHKFGISKLKLFNNKYIEYILLNFFLILILISIFIFYFLMSIGAIVGLIVYFILLLKINVFIATLFALVMTPINFIGFWCAVSYLIIIVTKSNCEITDLSDKSRNLLLTFSVGINGSFSLTLGALSLGHIISPTAWIPQTAQMLLLNILCDGLTLVVAFWLLRWAIMQKKILRIPCAIIIDIMISSVLAGLSLYCGLVFTKHHLSIREIGNVFIGIAAEGGRLEFGPYFWAMHTTFIPIIIYLGLILICWVGKVVLILSEKFTNRAMEHEKPFALTATLCGVLFAIFTAVSLWLRSLQGN